MAQFKTVFGLVGALLVPIVVMPSAEALDPTQEPLEESLLVFEAADDFVLIEGSGSTLIEVVANDDSVADDSVVTVSVVTPPGLGTATVKTDGEDPVVKYEPDSGAAGVDTFVYEACEGTVCSTATATVYVGTSGCTITGTNRADKLVGTEGDDVICGRKGGDVIDALGGNDLVFGGRGRDIIIGGDGDDVLRGGLGNDTIDGGAGDDRIQGRRGRDTISGGVGDDVIRGGWGNDILDGGDGADYVFGGRGNDTIDGGAGNDVLRGGRGEDTIGGGEGTDKLFGGPGADQLLGGPGDDNLYGRRGADNLQGGPGTDTLNGGRGTDACTTGETLTNCEGGDGPDVTPPVTDVTVEDKLESDGALELGLTATDDGGGVESVVLISPDGFVYDVTQVDPQTWAAVIDADRLFPEQDYDFVFVVTDSDGNATVTDTVSITVPARTESVPTTDLELESAIPLGDLLEDFAATGVQPFELTHTRQITQLSDLPADTQAYIAQNPEAASSFLNRPMSGVAMVNGTPLSQISETYAGLYSEQGGTGSPVITGLRVIAPSVAALSDFEAASGASQPEPPDPTPPGQLQTDPTYTPGDEPLKEPFWPTIASVQWADTAEFTYDKWGWCNSWLDCLNPTNSVYDHDKVTFEGRRISGFATGLDEYFRPYYNAHTDRAYEFDVSQINLDQEDFKAQWIMNFGGDSKLRPFGPFCDSAEGDNFPIARFGLESISSHDFASIEVKQNNESFSLFETNVNSEAGPYPDTFVGDPCHKMDLSFGIAKPYKLDPTIHFLTYSLTAARGTVDKAGLAFVHQTLDANPALDSDLDNVLAIVCWEWSNIGLTNPNGVLGTNFCTGVNTKKTRNFTMLASAETKNQRNESFPWVTMDFNSDIDSVCMNSETPGALFKKTGNNLDMPYQLGYGLVSVRIDCEDNFVVWSPHTLPGLEAGESYSFQLELAAGQTGTWEVLEDPLARYRPDNVDYPGGLPDGLSLNPATGEISGTPTEGADTAKGPLYATIRVKDGERTAIHQVAFGAFDEPAPDPLPENTSPPALTEGTYLDRTVLRANAGTWTNAGTYVYSWLSCDTDGDNCIPLEDEYSACLPATSDVATRSIRVQVQAINEVGTSEPAISEPVVPSTTSVFPYEETLGGTLPTVGDVIRVSLDENGDQHPTSTFGSRTFGISGDGGVVAYNANSGYVRGTFSNELLANATTTGFGGPSLSENGRYIGYSAGGSTKRAYRFDTACGEHRIMNRNPLTGAHANTWHSTSYVSLTPDGRFAVFASLAGGFVPEVPDNGVSHVYHFDMATGELTLISVTDDGVPGDGDSGSPHISSTGVTVSFWSEAPNLKSDSTFDGGEIYVRNLSTHTLQQISVGIPRSDRTKILGAAANSSAGDALSQVSFSGESVMWTTTGNWPGYDEDTMSGTGRVFIWDRATGTNSWVNPSLSGGSPAMSRDGKWVAFVSSSEDLVGDSNGECDVFLTQVGTDAYRIVSSASDGPQGNGSACRWQGPALSDDGSFVAFQSLSDNLVSGDTNQESDVFVFVNEHPGVAP